MRADLNELLACPICHSTLELTVQKEEEGDIIAGSLRCTSAECGQSYPIEDGIPNLLPPQAQSA